MRCKFCNPDATHSEIGTEERAGSTFAQGSLGVLKVFLNMPLVEANAYHAFGTRMSSTVCAAKLARAFLGLESPQGYASQTGIVCQSSFHIMSKCPLPEVSKHQPVAPSGYQQQANLLHRTNWASATPARPSTADGW